jgi:phosphoribosylamine--glycine ligase
MRVCVVGSGAREHALAVALGRTSDVIACPGNAGMSALGVACVGAPPETLDADLFVIGPEAPLVDGLADRLRSGGKLVFGPGAEGARLEGSKAWMKDVLSEALVPTAAYGVFDHAGPAVEFLRALPGPWVVKTDGLAAGKGVLVTADRDAAEADVRAKLSGASFGEAGRRVVIEEGLTGRELSVMAVCDGERAVALAPAQDYKRAGDGDSGPNTGGMGAYSPVPAAGEDVVAEVLDRAIVPTLMALGERGIGFRGVLYAGIMLTASGPKVLEFNVRFGDPETEVVLARWHGDVAGTLAAAARGRLDIAQRPEFTPDASVCVVLAAPGYPEAARIGDEIKGLDDARHMDGVEVFAAGVAAGPGGALVTAGGRVLAVTATAPSLTSARTRAYDAAATLSWPDVHYRTDIAASTAASTDTAAQAVARRDIAASTAASTDTAAQAAARGE